MLKKQHLAIPHIVIKHIVYLYKSLSLQVLECLYNQVIYYFVEFINPLTKLRRFSCTYECMYVILIRKHPQQSSSIKQQTAAQRGSNFNKRNFNKRKGIRWLTTVTDCGVWQ